MKAKPAEVCAQIPRGWVPPVELPTHEELPANDSLRGHRCQVGGEVVGCLCVKIPAEALKLGG